MAAKHNQAHMTISPLLARYECVLLDLDGCVWVGDEPTARAVEAIEALRAAHKRIGFITNDARHSEEEFVRKLWRLGFKASVEEVVTVGGAVQHHLAERSDRLGSAFVVGAQPLVDHVADAGVQVVNNTDLATRADLVVVGGHEGFNYAELRTATQALARGADLLGTARDPTFPMPDGPWPSSGSILAAVEHASGRTAATVGKPQPGIFLAALDRLGVSGASVLVVGDRLDTDVAGAAAAELDSALVLSGATDREAAEAALARAPEDGTRPTAVADDLGTLVLGGA